MKQEVKVVLIPPTATATQIEGALQARLNAGWKLVAIFDLGTNTFAVMIKIVAV